jgi:hypothetical protein
LVKNVIGILVGIALNICFPWYSHFHNIDTADS